MPDNFFFQHIWIIFILVTCVNAAIIYKKSRRLISDKPELKIGYEKIIKGFLFWFNLPWIVMGIGFIYGGAHNIFDYFNIRSNNPYIQAWLVTIVFEWILGFYWIYFRSGAEMLVAHPGIFRYDFKSTREVKLFYLVCIFGGIMGLFIIGTNII